MVDSGYSVSSSSVDITGGVDTDKNEGVRNRSRRQQCAPILKKRIPIIEWLPKYKAGYIFLDAIAGITVGLTAVPQGIAYAGVAGLLPQYGLYSGLMGCFVYLILGSCKDVNIGPTAIMALMIQPHVTKMGPDIAVLASFLTGCIVFILGILQLGFLVDFISYPVVAGFTSAAALTIGSSQLPGLFGIKASSKDFLNSWTTIFGMLPEANWPDSLLSFGSILFLLFAKWLGSHKRTVNESESTILQKILHKIYWGISLSRNAIVVLFGTILAWRLAQDNIQPFKIIGDVGEGLPPFQLPPFSTEFGNKTYSFPDMAKQLGTTIIFMPLVAILESIAITKAFSKGKSVDATQEMIALGCCNIGGSFIRSMSVTGSFTRTALNNAAGVVTTLGGIFTAIVVFLALELLTSTFYFIPKATLSAVIIVAMAFMMEIEIVSVLWRTKKIELLLYFITLIGSLFLGIEYGILIGIATNISFILYNNARPTIEIKKMRVSYTDVVILTPTQCLYFPTAEYLRQKVLAESEIENFIIINGQFVMMMDVTVARNIKHLADDITSKSKTIILWNFREDIKKTCGDFSVELEKFFMMGNLENIIEKLN